MLPISPGILAVTVILGFELIIICFIVGYLLYRGNSGKKSSDLPKDEKYTNDSSTQCIEDLSDDAYVVEDETTTKKSAPTKVSEPSSLSSIKSNQQNEDEEVSKSEITSECENDVEDKENKDEVNIENETKDVEVEKECTETNDVEDNQKDIQEESTNIENNQTQVEEDIEEDISFSLSERSSVSSSSSSSSSSDEKADSSDSDEADCDVPIYHLPQLKKSDLEESDHDAEPILIESFEDKSITENATLPMPDKKPLPEEKRDEIQPKNSHLIDVGGITLSLRIEPGSNAPAINVNGQDFCNPSNEEQLITSDQEYKSLASHNDEIQVIRRYEPVQNQFESLQNKETGDINSKGFENNYDITGEIEGEEEVVAGVINVTSGEKLTICQAMKNGLIPKKTGLLLLEAQAATGSIVNPRNGVKMSVAEAIMVGVIDENYRQTLVSAEGAYYGYLDPRTGQNVSLTTAMNRDIFPKSQGLRLLEAQVATGGVIDPWTGLRYSIDGALAKGLLNRETVNLLKNPEEQTEFLDPTTRKKLSYSDLLNKCIRDLDTGLKFLYIEEKPKVIENPIQPDLLTFRTAFRRKVTLQDLIDAGLVENRILESFQNRKLNKEDLRDALRPYLIGEDPIAGVLDRSSQKILTFCEAVDDGILRRSTALELLEAQAATGSIIDPVSRKKMSVKRAISTGLISSQFASRLRQAEQIVHGRMEPGTRKTLSLFEAVSRGVVIESHELRMLEAQVATGGVVDPEAGYRIPTKMALERQLFDPRMAKILSGSNPDLKGYFDPNTGNNVTYSELMQSCVNHRKYGNVLLLPIRGKTQMKTARKRGSYRDHDMQMKPARQRPFLSDVRSDQLSRQARSWAEY